jgi:hypothetical protein
MTAVMNKFDQDVQVLQGIREESVELFDKFETQHRVAQKSLFDYLNESDVQEAPFFFSKWMEKYLEFEQVFFGDETPQNATLGAELEFAIKSIIKRKFPNAVSKDFVSSHKQIQYGLGRMEIGIPVKTHQIIVQVKRGFDSAIWHRILQEKAMVESTGDRYLLVSPTEYTNEEIRSEIREKHLWNWVFLWKEKNRTGECYSDWIERFLRKLSELLSLS